MLGFLVAFSEWDKASSQIATKRSRESPSLVLLKVCSKITCATPPGALIIVSPTANVELVPLHLIFMFNIKKRREKGRQHQLDHCQLWLEQKTLVGEIQTLGNIAFFLFSAEKPVEQVDRYKVKSRLKGKPLNLWVASLSLVPQTKIF